MLDFLRMEHIQKNFGGVQALRDVSFSIEAGQVCALIGENGAGKSTLGKIIAGVEPADGGALFLNGEAYNPQTPLEAQKKGVAMIFQELDLFPNQSVAANLALGNLELMDKKQKFVNRKILDKAARPWLEKVGLSISSDLPLGSLPIAYIQLVAIARALSMNTRLIVMDEPTSALTGEATEILFNTIGKLIESGVTVIYVSHKMEEIFRIADSIVVMRDGKYIGTRKKSETDANEMISMMVGRTFAAKPRQAVRTKTEVLLSVKDLRTKRLSGLSFDLRAGEVLGIAGLVGSGRTELGEALFGLDYIQSGSIAVKGRPYMPRFPRDAMKAGVGLIPEDRGKEGLFIKQSVADNMAISVMEDNQRFGFIRRDTIAALVSDMIGKTRLKAANARAGVNTLSGGNQQKALVCRWLMVDPMIIFLDDPTRGVDVGAKEDIYEIIETLASRDKGILFVSSELPELLRSADRIMVLCQGRAAGIVDARNTSQHELMRLSMGYGETLQNN
ncbi:MAG: sugar ABC transporter ATP-binding protein [Treponema sp.]|jgi:ABC-type sugar transport system ATPase subunit|nr:sugar ABC transporter ATP-binding protein [Treponema sp.]